MKSKFDTEESGMC